MVHTLIISPRGCGAGELAQDILAELGRPVYGFITKKEDSLAETENGSPIFIREPGSPWSYTQDSLVGYCKNHRFRTIPGAFDRFAPRLMTPVTAGSVYLMDTLGFMESQEIAFCHAVLSLLDGDVPVIACMKDKEFPFLNTVRDHPKCRCFHLTRENRDELFREILAHMRKQLSGSMVARLKPGICPAHNQEDLNYFLTLQETTFPNSPWYTPQRWDSRADVWETERRQHRRHDERVAATVEFLTQRGILVPDCRIADIGCGPGRFAAAFAQKAGSVVGLDISPKMVSYGNEYIQNLGLPNAELRCCDFSQLDIQREGYVQGFDLVFSSQTPAIHNMDGLMKSMEMSRAWCLNITHIQRRNYLRNRILAEVFHRSNPNRDGGRSFYALFNILFLMGYGPETSFFTRRIEKRVHPDDEYVGFVMEHALPMEEHNQENAKKIQLWLASHRDEDGLITEISDAVYGRILWDVRKRSERPDFRSLIR